MPKATRTEVEKRIINTINKSDGIVNYDDDNAYPQRCEDIINSSGTGALCSYMLRKFIFGGGFADKDFYKQIVNKQGLTADKLARKSARYLSKHNGMAFHVNYNLMFNKVEVSPIPFKTLRFTTEDRKKHPNKIAVYYDWEKESERQIDWKKVDFIDFYNPDPKVIQQQVDEAGGWANYKGQILYWTDEGVEYPLSPGDAVLDDMLTDSKIKYFKFRNVTTNFMASHIVEVDEFESGEDGEGSDDKQAFMQELQSFQGSDDALKILLLEKKSGASPTTITKLDIQDLDKLYQYTEESVRDNIIRQYGIPPMLLLAVAGKLGNSTEIVEATEFYNANTADYRLILEEVFAELFSNFVTDINPSGNYSLLPLRPAALVKIEKEYFGYVTKNQVLESMGLPTVNDVQAEVTALYEKLGVGGIQGFVDIITNEVLTSQQKIETLILLFKVTREAATLVINGGATTTI